MQLELLSSQRELDGVSRMFGNSLGAVADQCANDAHYEKDSCGMIIMPILETE